MGVELLLVKEFFKKVSEQITTSIKFLMNPSSWRKGYEQGKEYFPHLKTLVMDDIDIPKIVEFVTKNRKEQQVYTIITTIALINGAIAFVPGQMGIGVVICRGLEAYMAFEISKTVGLKVELKNFVKLIIATGIVTVSVFWLMKTFLSFFFSLTGGLFVPAEILATNFLGVFFWLAFEEIKKFKEIKSLSTVKSLKIGGQAIKHSYELAKAQIKVIGNVGKQLKNLSKNIWHFINFKKNSEQLIKGDVFFALCLARLLENKCDTFNGPFGTMYLDAWRKSFTQKLGPEASCVDIAKFAQSHSADQMEGLQKPVRGKLQEIMESTYENGDNDEWSTSISDSPNEPVVDMKWTNSLTGKSYYVQYKNTENINYIERTIQDHPNVPIVVPKGVAEKVNHPMVSDGVYGHETLGEINDENFNNLLDVHHGEFLAQGGLEAGVLVLATNIMPFVYARHKKQISNEQFAQVLKKFIPNITAKTIHRITLLSIIGPLYAFFLISKFVGKVFLDGIDDDIVEEVEKKKDKSKKMGRREFFLFFKPKII